MPRPTSPRPCVLPAPLSVHPAPCHCDTKPHPCVWCPVSSGILAAFHLAPVPTCRPCLTPVHVSRSWSSSTHAWPVPSSTPAVSSSVLPRCHLRMSSTPASPLTPAPQFVRSSPVLRISGHPHTSPGLFRAFLHTPRPLFTRHSPFSRVPHGFYTPPCPSSSSVPRHTSRLCFATQAMPCHASQPSSVPRDPHHAAPTCPLPFHSDIPSTAPSHNIPVAATQKTWIVVRRMESRLSRSVHWQNTR